MLSVNSLFAGTIAFILVVILSLGSYLHWVGPTTRISANEHGISCSDQVPMDWFEGVLRALVQLSPWFATHEDKCREGGSLTLLSSTLAWSIGFLRVNKLAENLRSEVQTRTLNATFYRRRMSDWIRTLSENPSSRSISVKRPCGRLGNWMFQMASLVGVAKASGRIPLPFKGPTSRNVIFEELSELPKHASDVSQNVRKQRTVGLRGSVTLREKGAGTFTGSIGNVAKRKNKHVTLKGCLQSWKYFSAIRNEITSLLAFKPEVYHMAVSRIQHVFYEKRWLARDTPEPLKVGIHVRRGDFLLPSVSGGGSIPAPDAYFGRAVRYLERKSPFLVFFVISQDYQYCVDLFRNAKHKFHIVRERSPEDDMAILHLMDYVIISSGTFGWWGAFLSRAKEVVYYKNWPAPNSFMSPSFVPGDYFPPYWTSMS